VSANHTALERVDGCDLCGGTRFSPRKRWRDPLMFGPETWQLVRCDDCGLHFINPRPTRDSIGGFYPNDYGAHTAPPTAAKRWHKRVSAREVPDVGFFERQWLHVRQNVSWYRMPAWHGEGHVLDIGCGSGGRYLDILKELGWTTYGVEPSAHAVEAAVAKGHRALVGAAEQQLFPDQSMDLVTIWHVLEHSHSPREALGSIRRMLKPTGQLSLCVPNYGSLQAKSFGRFWWSCDAPRHLFQFTKPTLTRYLEDSGFRVKSITTRTAPTSWQRAGRHLLNATFRTKWTRDSKVAVTLAEPFIAMLSVVRFFGVGAELRVIAEPVS
jgi:ubiquinone/menaquinone biosynthesis C-methylase UbiE